MYRTTVLNTQLWRETQSAAIGDTIKKWNVEGGHGVGSVEASVFALRLGHAHNSAGLEAAYRSVNFLGDGVPFVEPF